MTVEWVELGELVSTQAGVAVESDREYAMAGVYSFGRGLLRRPAIPGTGTKYASLTELSEGNLVYSKLGAFEGAVAVVGARFAGRWVTPEFPVFTVSEFLDPGFLHHFVSSENFRGELARSSTGVGARQKRVAPGTFLALKVPLPPIGEQRRIAAHLDLVGEAGARRSRASALARAWPVSLRDRVVAEAGGQMTPLGVLLSAREAEAVRSDASYRITGVYSFGRGLLDRGPLAGHETKYAAMTTLHEGDVVYSKLGAFEDAVAVVGERFAGTHVSPEFPVFEVVEEVDPAFLVAALTTTSFAESLIQAATGVGARQKRVSPSAFLRLEIPVPTIERQRQAGGLLRRAERIASLDAKVRTVTDALLPAARNEIFSAMR